MLKSESLTDFAPAMAAAQAAVKGAVKDSENPHFRSRYADLASVREACMGALTQHGFSVLQSPRLVSAAEGWVVEVETLILHASGQWVSDTAATPIGKADAQAVGSAVTYLRRYALAAFASVAPEDDDANAAVAAGPGPRPVNPASPKMDPAVDVGKAKPLSVSGGPTKIVDMTSKPIKNGALTQWLVVFADGRSGTTINEKLSVKAMNARDDDAEVQPEITINGKFANLTGLAVLGADDGPPPLDDNDIPFGWLLPLAIGMLGFWA